MPPETLNQTEGVPTPLERVRSVLTTGSDVKAKRAEILHRFKQDWDVFESLFDCFKGEETFKNRPCSLRHPHLWYFAHTACFFVNKLRSAKVLEHPVDAAFESLFAIGVDEMSWDDKLEDREWPPMSQLREYRRNVRAMVIDKIETIEFTLPITWESDMWPILMGIDHQRIHCETSSVLVRQTRLDLLNPVSDTSRWKECHDDPPPPKNELLDVPERCVSFGNPPDHRLYGWDNEYGERKEVVTEFKASKYLVSNEEYHEFVSDGGYESKELWTSEGWRWITTTGVRYPTFWVPESPDVNPKSKTGWKLRNMTTEVPMKWSWPVVVNHLEAEAFCSWKAKKTGLPIRLPTESEWNVMRDRSHPEDEPDWEVAPGNVNLEHYGSECPVNVYEQGHGFYDVYGNVWQHCATPFQPFKGFKTHPIYDDFSVPCFDNLHSVLKGSAWVSMGNLATRHFRNSFRRHFFQHAGIRYVSSDAELPPENVSPPRPLEVSKMIDSHFGRFEHVGLPNFLQTLVAKTVQHLDKHERVRALDVACGVGRATFELGRYFKHALGIDISTAHINVPLKMLEQSYVNYSSVEEGEIKSLQSRTLMEMELEHAAKNVEFLQNDVAIISPEERDFNFVLCANVLDQIAQPRRFLQEIPGRMAPGGVLVVASTNEWNPKKSDKSVWLGGYVDERTNEEVRSIDGLTEVLSPAFEPIAKPFNLPFAEKVNARRFDYRISEVTVWRKK